MRNEETVNNLFNTKRWSAYDIHNYTGVPIKEVYHIISQNEQARGRHKKTVYEKRQEDLK